MPLPSRGPLEDESVSAAARHLSVALQRLPDATNAGVPIPQSGKIAEAVGGSGVGSVQDHADVALLPRVIAAAADPEAAAALGLSDEQAKALRRVVEVCRQGDEAPLDAETLRPIWGLAKRLNFVNYGSFGGPALPVAACQVAYKRMVDADPERFLMRQLFGMLEDVHRVLAGYMGLPTSDNIALVDNAGDGFNVVAESVIFNPAFYARVKGKGSRDPLRIGLMSNGYPMVRNTVQYWVDRQAQLAAALGDAGDKPAIWTYDVNVLSLTQEMVDSIEKATNGAVPDALVDGIVSFAAEKKLDVLIIDHIAFAPAFIMPVEEISRRVKAHNPNAFIVIDAAHAIGAIPLEGVFGGKGPAFDAWFSNNHKWLMAPKQSAVLWFSDAVADLMHPTIKSNLYRGDPAGDAARREEALKNVFANSNGLRFPATSEAARRRAEFYWRGTRDHTAILTIPDVIWLRRQLGEERIVRHNRELALKGGKAMAAEWGTELLLTNAEWLPPMATVRLPTDDNTLIQAALDTLVTDMGGHFPTLRFNGHAYCRVSPNVFSDVSEFVTIAQRFSEALAQAKLAKQTA